MASLLPASGAARMAEARLCRRLAALRKRLDRRIERLRARADADADRATERRALESLDEDEHDRRAGPCHRA